MDLGRWSRGTDGPRQRDLGLVSVARMREPDGFARVEAISGEGLGRAHRGEVGDGDGPDSAAVFTGEPSPAEIDLSGGAVDCRDYAAGFLGCLVAMGWATEAD